MIDSFSESYGRTSGRPHAPTPQRAQVHALTETPAAGAALTAFGIAVVLLLIWAGLSSVRWIGYRL